MGLGVALLRSSVAVAASALNAMPGRGLLLDVWGEVVRDEEMGVGVRGGIAFRGVGLMVYGIQG